MLFLWPIMMFGPLLALAAIVLAIVYAVDQTSKARARAAAPPTPASPSRDELAEVNAALAEALAEARTRLGATAAAFERGAKE